MTDTLYTVQELLADEDKRRRAAGEVLANQPWPHTELGKSGVCSKCGKIIAKRESYYHENVEYDQLVWFDTTPCPVPDPAPGSEADIAQALVRKVSRDGSVGRCLEMVRVYLKPSWEGYSNEAGWFAFDATPAERIVCCLMALLPERITL